MKLTFMVPWSKSKVNRTEHHKDHKSQPSCLAGDQARQADVQVHGLRQPAGDLAEDDRGHLRPGGGGRGHTSQGQGAAGGYIFLRKY